MVYMQVVEDRDHANPVLNVFPYRVRFFQEEDHEVGAVAGVSVTFNIGCGISQMAITVPASVLDLPGQESGGAPVPTTPGATANTDDHPVVHTTEFIAGAGVAAVAVVAFIVAKLQHRKSGSQRGADTKCTDNAAPTEHAIFTPAASHAQATV